MGDTFDQRLKKSGNAVWKNAAYQTDVGSLFYPAKDDPNYGAVAHPRENDPLDQEMVDDIVNRFLAGEMPIEYPALVWDIGPGVDGKIRLLVINGCRRDKHGQAAQEKLRALGKLGPSDVLRIGVNKWVPPKKATNEEVFAALIFERLKQNTDPHKKPDSARVLSDQIRALRVLGKTNDEIKPFMPKGVGLREIEALANLDSMHPDARSQFDNGAPIGLIPVVLGAPRENQAEKATEVIATGATSTRGVTRKANAKVKKDAGKPFMKMNAQRVEKVADVFLEQHDSAVKFDEEIDWTLYWISIGARLTTGDTAALEEARKQLPEEARNEFDQKIGAVKGESRGRGRPRKVTVTVPVVNTETDTDEPDDEDEDDDGEPNPFKDILNRPDTPNDDDDDETAEDVDD